MFKLFLILIFSILFMFSNIFSQEVEFSGWGATGIKIYDRNVLRGYSQEMFYEGKLQAEIEYNDNIEAQLDFRGNSVDNSLEFREFSVKFKFAENLRWKVGNIKKPFGYEQSINREQLISTDRSNVYNNISDLGYGGRSISVMAYYNYSKKREDYPYSYYISVFKDNSLISGAATRGIYHIGNYSYGLSYLFQNRGGANSINSHGFSAEFIIDKKEYSTSAEVYLVQDPVQGQSAIERNKINGTNENESVFAAGAKLLTALEYKTDAEVITKIEPFVQTSYYLPNMDKRKYHMIQGVIGANFYFTKKIRLRFDGNIIFTKNDLNEDYVTDESLVTLELQVRF
jgi:hypothetical protein